MVVLGEKIDNEMSLGEKFPKGGAPNSKGWLKSEMESAEVGKLAV